MNEQELAQKYCIFRCTAGSHSYATNIKNSDVDTRGIFIAPPEYTLGCLKPVEQVEVPGEDTVIYELAKFVKLAVDCNPNLIELLFSDEENILFIDPAFETLRAHRELFLSKKAKFTFSGYAMAQMKRIRGHNKWLNQPQPERPPDLMDFAKLIYPNGDVAPGGVIEGFVSTFLVKVNATTFRVYSASNFSKSPLSADRKNLQFIDVDAARLADAENLQFFGTLIVQQDTYRVQHRMWKDYWHWKKNRNPARAELEEKYGYDCYSDDTEFLTELGWQMFDDVLPGTALATLSPKTFKVEYQLPLERHEAEYTGSMCHFSGHHTDINVSANHRMFLNPVKRRSGDKVGWRFAPACMVPETFLIVNRINPITHAALPNTLKNIDLRLYLKIMGWYVSEGSIIKKSSGATSALSISQLKGGRLHWRISRAIHDYGGQVNISCYSHYRKSKDRTELTWIIRDKELVQDIVHSCGERSANKKLPRWVMSLPKRMKEILLNSLHAGDGTDCRPHDAQVYYTASPQLADDVQELAFLCGFETAKWGMYKNDGIGMYHVHINKTAKQFRTLTRKNIESRTVANQRIVCFTVPNEILITRRNGNIGIQGNTKHAMHLMRLLKMSHEILREGKVIVRRPDAKELLAIRDGAFSYEQLVSTAKRMDEELNELYEQSTLPHSADKEAINDLYMNVVRDYWTRQGLLSCAECEPPKVQKGRCRECRGPLPSGEETGICDSCAERAWGDK